MFKNILTKNSLVILNEIDKVGAKGKAINILGVAKKLNKNYVLIYREIKRLEKLKLIDKVEVIKFKSWEREEVKKYTKDLRWGCLLTITTKGEDALRIFREDFKK